MRVIDVDKLSKGFCSYCADYQTCAKECFDLEFIKSQPVVADLITCGECGYYHPDEYDYDADCSIGWCSQRKGTWFSSDYCSFGSPKD